MVTYGMVIDQQRCVRCHACTVACKSAHGTPAGVSWHHIVDQEYGTYPNATRLFLTSPCKQCDNAACLEVCPTGATYKRPDGIVLIDQSKCIGCKYCVLACPFGARQITSKVTGYFPEMPLTPLEQALYSQYPGAGVATKCTFCADIIDAGVAAGLKPGVDRDATPACVNTCPTEARIFGDLDDPSSAVALAARDAVPYQSNMGTQPKVTYRNGRLPPSKLAALG